MAEMSAYCKAYEAKRLRAYPGWKEDASDLRQEMTEVDGKEVESARDEIGDDDILYVHDDYVVTDDVFRDQNVVFSEVTDEWREFCHEELDFEVPQFARPEEASAEG
ncbi:MAG TPA: hypothetical protein VKU40_18280 [Thermoanaerobaculia bacterium]|nr:hypothetical protein [Thermoanaerobaculia bacterium]